MNHQSRIFSSTSDISDTNSIVDDLPPAYALLDLIPQETSEPDDLTHDLPNLQPDLSSMETIFHYPLFNIPLQEQEICIS